MLRFCSKFRRVSLRLLPVRKMATSNEEKLIFRQLFEKETSSFTYLLGCAKTRDAVLIDPVLECVERDLNVLKELNLNLKYGMNTHVHADHITGTGKIKSLLKDCKSVLGLKSGAKADIYVKHGEKFPVGNLVFECRSTPGHTNGCITYVLHDHKMAFTGDALLIRGCGRTDFQQGSSTTLYKSVYSQIFSLPPAYKLYPAHDYKGFSVTTVEEETKYNTRLLTTEAEFIDIMKNLNLSYPEKIDVSLPSNMVCGIQEKIKAA